MIQIPSGAPASYEARVERGSLAHAGDVVRRYLPAGGRAVVVTTPTVRRHWGAALEASLRAAAIAPLTLELPDGESFKRLSELENLADAMVASGCDRDTLVVAFGGGVVGDVAAFLASIYMRGVRLVQIPTTLVAMIDSSLGGKTGVNLEHGKNLIGTFYHPQHILVDPQVLATLAGREFRAGMAEAVKYGVIGDAALFDQIEQYPQGWDAAPAALDAMIAGCLRQKAEVVMSDEREGGRRRILNFGHTLGHAFESATNYSHFLHGEAVAWGMIAAGRIAVRRSSFGEREARRMNAVILAACGPLPELTLDPELVLRHAASDKKAHAGVLTFILPTAIGMVEVVRDVTRDQILAALADTASMSS